MSESDKPKRTLSYARVSGVAQKEDGYSLESQRDRAADYARFRGWPAPIHFADGAVSGKRTQRPALDALLAACRPGDVVLVKDVTRVGRGGAVQTLGIIADMEGRGASVVFVDQNIDTSTPLGRLILTMMAGFSELELEQTRERVHQGRLQAARLGHWPTASVPYGYRRNKARKLEPDPDTAPHARAALRALEGRSLRQAVAYLNEQGIPANTAKKGRGVWNIVRLHEMMSNTAYVGRAQIRVGRETVEIPCEPLISEELWASIRNRASSEGGTPKPDRYPLTGHLRCEHGAPYSGETARGRAAGGGDWRAYEVSSGARRRYGCRCPQIGADEAEALAREALARIFEAPNDPLYARVLSHPAALTPDPHEGERAEVRAQLSNLADLQVRGLIELEDYMRLRSDLKAREASLVAPAPVEPSIWPDLQELAGQVRRADRAALSELLDILGVRLLLTPDKRLEVLSVTRLA